MNRIEYYLEAKQEKLNYALRIKKLDQQLIEIHKEKKILEKSKDYYEQEMVMYMNPKNLVLYRKESKMEESDLVKKIIDKFRTKYGAIIFKFHGNQFTEIGIPDLIICYKGNFIAIEVKIGNNKPKEIQLEQIQRINEWGQGIALWVNERNWLEKIENAINELKWIILFKDIEKQLLDQPEFKELMIKMSKS